MDLYLIVGNPHTRRASVVRSLTGCFNRSVRDIELLSGKATLKLYARVGSLQETKTRPQDFVTEVAAARCRAVLRCAECTGLGPHPVPICTRLPGPLQGTGLARAQHCRARAEQRRHQGAHAQAVSTVGHGADQHHGLRGAQTLRLALTAIVRQRTEHLPDKT